MSGESFSDIQASPGMKRNVGAKDRLFRALAALAMLGCAVMAPLPLFLRLPIFGAMSAYLLFTAACGSCGGYALLGRSTCPAASNR